MGEVTGEVNFIVNIKEFMLTSRSEVFEAVNGEGVVTRRFSLHLVDGGFKFYDGEWYIGFL